MFSVCSSTRQTVARFCVVVIGMLIAPNVMLTQVNDSITVDRIVWSQTDFVVQFSEEVGYNVDLAESDSNRLVIRLDQPVQLAETSSTGPGGITAEFSRSGDGFVDRLTLQSEKRFGYSTLWRPYSHRLVVHTFDWSALEYAGEQYHEGLLALEEGLEGEAIEKLSAARAADNGSYAQKAGSILGILFARRGNDSLASLYLKAPIGPDDYAARAEVRRRAGDEKGASDDEMQFDAAMSRGNGIASVGSDTGAAGVPPTRVEETGGARELISGWRGILIFCVAALFIILLAFWFARSPVEGEEKGDSETGKDDTDQKKHGAPTPVTSTMTSPSIDVEDQDAANAEEEDSDVVLPRPDAFPAEDKPSPGFTRREPPSAEDLTVPGTGSEEQSEENAAGSHRESRQAAQLRRRMMGGSGDEPESERSDPETPEPDQEEKPTIDEAREQNVSRDYVELQRRITEMRRKLDGGSSGSD